MKSEPLIVRWAPQILVAAFVVGAVFLSLLAWSNWTNSRDISAILALEEGRELVESWTIEALDERVVLGGATLLLRGDFICTEAALAADPVVQFRASYAPTADGGIEVPRPLRPPRPISTSCTNSSGPVEFGVPWDTAVVNGLGTLQGPQEYVMFFSVEGDGWRGASTATDAFTLLPADG